MTRSPGLDPGAVLSTAGFTVLVYAIIEAAGARLADPTVLGAIAGGSACWPLFVWWELHTDEPMLDLGFSAAPASASGRP